MARVFLSRPTGAEVVVFSHDHCPPHLTAIHRAQSWVARVRFSFVTNVIALWDIEPIRCKPRKGVVNALLDDVENNLFECRRHWWNIQQTACLDNRWARDPRQGQAPPLALLARTRPAALQVASSAYDADRGTLHVRFTDGPEIEIIAGTGDEI